MNHEPEQYTTDRGFRRIDFKDANHDSCSLQESSSATRNLIWLGCDDNRMHLDEPTAAFLWPILKRFAETGMVHPEQDDRIPCATCKGSGFILESDERPSLMAALDGLSGNELERLHGLVTHPEATDSPSTVATPEDGVARTQGDLAEELEFLAKAIEDVLKTIDLEAERFGKLEIHQKLGKTDWSRVARWLRERITAQAGATEIRRLRARVAELEEKNCLLREAYDDL